MLFFAEQATESETVRKRISREHLSIEYLRAVRIADSHERCSATDKFAKATHGKGFGGSPETIFHEDGKTYKDQSNIDANKGIVDNWHRPYPELCASMKRINQNVYRLIDHFDGKYKK